MNLLLSLGRGCDVSMHLVAPSLPPSLLHNSSWLTIVTHTTPGANHLQSWPHSGPLVPPNTPLTPQVHAFNVLRQVFKDASMAHDASGWHASGVAAAVRGMAADEWEVRVIVMHHHVCDIAGSAGTDRRR